MSSRRKCENWRACRRTDSVSANMAISNMRICSIKGALILCSLLNSIGTALAVEVDAHQIKHGTATHPSGADSATSFCKEQNAEVGDEGPAKYTCKMPGLLCDFSQKICRYPSEFGDGNNDLTISLYMTKYTLLPVNSSIFIKQCTLKIYSILVFS